MEAYEAKLIAQFNALGIKSEDIKLRVNVLPAKGWIKMGFVPKKGSHGVNGLFHESQITEIAA